MRASCGPAMKRVDRLRIRKDDEIARLMQTEAGQAEYWRRLDTECRQSPLIELLEESLGLEGDVIECGVYRGATTRLMGRRMRDVAPSKKLFACDSFEGFPRTGYSTPISARSVSASRSAASSGTPPTCPNG